MSQIEVTDREGWRRLYPLQKALAHVGSHPHSDVVLDAARGGGVAPRHLQLIATPGGYRLVNLGDTELMMANGKRLPVRGFTDLANEEQFKVGDFTLMFYLEGGPTMAFAPGGSGPGLAPLANAAEPISLSVRLSGNTLSPAEPIEGTLTVRNQGEKTGAQFRLEVEGLPTGAYEIGPGPILFPNAQKEVFLKLLHPRQPQPALGPCRVTFRASAPLTYPGVSVVVTQTIQIQPYYAHQVRFHPVKKA